MPKKRETNENGERKCARCGEFKPEAAFHNAHESYDRECRSAYSREYNENRKMTDPTFLAIRAAKARKRYRTDEYNRARRNEASYKWMSKIKNELAKAEKGIKPDVKPEVKPVAEPEPVKETPRERRQEAETKWSDL